MDSVPFRLPDLSGVRVRDLVLALPVGSFDRPWERSRALGKTQFPCL